MKPRALRALLRTLRAEGVTEYADGTVTLRLGQALAVDKPTKTPGPRPSAVVDPAERRVANREAYLDLVMPPELDA